MAAQYLAHALDQEREQGILDLWQRLYPWMAGGLLEFKSFKEFKAALLKPQIQYSETTTEDIEAEMLAIVAAYEGR